MIAPDLSEWLRMPEVAFEVFIGVHKDDKITCDRIGAVPRRLCADPQVDYIELAMNLPQAVDRAIQLFGNRCHLTSKSLSVRSSRPVYISGICEVCCPYARI